MGFGVITTETFRESLFSLLGSSLNDYERLIFSRLKDLAFHTVALQVGGDKSNDFLVNSVRARAFLYQRIPTQTKDISVTNKKAIPIASVFFEGYLAGLDGLVQLSDGDYDLYSFDRLKSIGDHFEVGASVDFEGSYFPVTLFIPKREYMECPNQLLLFEVN